MNTRSNSGSSVAVVDEEVGDGFAGGDDRAGQFLAQTAAREEFVVHLNGFLRRARIERYPPVGAGAEKSEGNGFVFELFAALVGEGCEPGGIGSGGHVFGNDPRVAHGRVIDGLPELFERGELGEFGVVDEDFDGDLGPCIEFTAPEAVLVASVGLGRRRVRRRSTAVAFVVIAAAAGRQEGKPHGERHQEQEEVWLHERSPQHLQHSRRTDRLEQLPTLVGD
jgi:hypothetical protein